MVRVEDRVTFVLVKAAKAHYRQLGARLAPFGLQPGQDMLLGALWRKDGQSQSELIERLGVEAPTITKGIGRLEKSGLLTRRRDPHDARVSRVHLTPEGKRLQKPISLIWEELESRAIAGLTAGECATLRTLAARVRSNIESRAAEDEPPSDDESPAGED